MKVILEHKDEFKQLLVGYTASDTARELVASIPLVILQGISGSGRNAIIKRLVETGEYHTVVSDTTRPPKIRDGVLEQDGINYHFRTEEQVLKDLHEGMFLEAELIHDQQVSGISIRELQIAHDSHKIPINEVAREGVENIRRIKPSTLFFFVVPPNYDIWIQRLTLRETMSEEEFSHRAASAILEIQEALHNDYFNFVINDDITRVASVINERVAGENIDNEQERGKIVAREILNELRARANTEMSS